MRDPKKERTSKKELRTMLESLAKPKTVAGFFKLGQFKARKVLHDGTIVHFIVTEPGHNRRPPR
jgi:hypothetical protein